MPNGRAPKGGVVGVNGEFYEGGKFLPSTQAPKGTAGIHKSTGKRQIEPGVWAEYRGTLESGQKADGFYSLISQDAVQYRRYLGQTEEQIEQELKPYREAWEQGMRWRIHHHGTLIRFDAV